MNQLLDDKLEFQDIFSKFTGISALKVSTFLRNNEIRTLFEHPEAVKATFKQVAKVNDLMRLYGLYKNLKTPENVYQMNTSLLAGEYFVNHIGGQRDREIFYCAMLNAQNEVIHTSAVHIGTLNEAPVYCREIVFEALRYGANSVIVAHNHPGGSLAASGPDLDVTKRLISSFKPISIPVVDHIIVANGRYASLAEQGLIASIGSQLVVEPVKNYSAIPRAASIAERMDNAKATSKEQDETTLMKDPAISAKRGSLMAGMASARDTGSQNH